MRFAISIPRISGGREVADQFYGERSVTGRHGAGPISSRAGRPVEVEVDPCPSLTFSIC
jgi:hypothetical protein